MTRLIAPWWTAGDRLTTESFGARQARYAYKPTATSRSQSTTVEPDPHLLLELDAGMWELSVRLAYSGTTGSRGVRVGWSFETDPTGVQPERLGWGPDPDSTSRTATWAQTRSTRGLSDSSDPPVDPRLYGTHAGAGFFAPLREDGLMSLPERTVWAITWAQHTTHADPSALAAGSWIRARPIMTLEAP